MTVITFVVPFTAASADGYSTDRALGIDKPSRPLASLANLKHDKANGLNDLNAELARHKEHRSANHYQAGCAACRLILFVAGEGDLPIDRSGRRAVFSAASGDRVSAAALATPSVGSWPDPASPQLFVVSSWGHPDLVAHERIARQAYEALVIQYGPERCSIEPENASHLTT